MRILCFNIINYPCDFNKRDKYFSNFILSKILNETFSNKKNIELFEKNRKDFFIPINAWVMQKTYEPYKKVITFLKENNYIEVDELYIPDGKSKGYRINRESNIHKGIHVVKDMTPYSKFIKLFEKYTHIKNTSFLSESNGEVYKYYVDMNERGVFMFDKQGQKLADKFFHDLKRDYLTTSNQGKKDTIKRKYQCAKASYYKILNKDTSMSFDRQGARFFMPHTNLTNDLLKYMKLDNKLCVYIDISNSQFQSLHSVLREEYPDYFYEEDVQRMDNLIRSGILYRYIQDELSLKESDYKRIKGSCFHFLYCGIDPIYFSEIVDQVSKENELTLEIAQLFLQKFPNWYAMIDKLKNGNGYNKLTNSFNDGGKILARKLQLKESSLVKKILRKTCLRENNKIYCYTKHDSFILPENVDHKVIDEILSMLREHGLDSVSIEYQRDILTDNELEVMGYERNEVINRYKDTQAIEIVNIITKEDEFFEDYVNNIDEFNALARLVKKGEASKGRLKDFLFYYFSFEGKLDKMFKLFISDKPDINKINIYTSTISYDIIKGEVPKPPPKQLDLSYPKLSFSEFIEIEF